MNLLATTANMLWGAGNLPAWAAFRRAVHHPRAAQEAVLHRIRVRAAGTAFGREHAAFLSAIKTAREQQRRNTKREAQRPS